MGTKTASTTEAKDRGTPWGPLDPEADIEVPGTPAPGRRPGSPPGTNPPEKLSVSVRPPWKRLAAIPTPSEKNTWMRRGHVASYKENPEGFSRQNPSGPKGAPVVSP